MIAKHILARDIKEAKEANKKAVTLPVIVAEQLLRDMDTMDQRLEKAVTELSAVSEEAFNRVFGDVQW